MKVRAEAYAVENDDVHLDDTHEVAACRWYVHILLEGDGRRIMGRIYGATSADARQNATLFVEAFNARSV